MKSDAKPVRVAQIMGKWVGGGVETVVMNYYKNIDKTKVQFDFIFDNDSKDIPIDEIENLGGKVILIPPYQKVFKYHKELKRLLKDGKYKIVHSHINTLSVFSLLAAKCAGTSIRIAHSHSTTNKKEKNKNLIKQVLRPFSKLFATDYMCCSELAGRWLFGDKEYDKGNVYLLNNAIDLDKFKYNEKIREEVRKKLGIDDDAFVIGHIGRFITQKNHNKIIDVFFEYQKKNNNSVLLLIGEGKEKINIKNKIEYLGIEKKVLFLGQRNDVNELFQGMDCFLFPSLYEGLGMVLIEAQCSNLKCVVSSEVPKAVKISDDLNFVDLSSTNDIWCEHLSKNARKDNTSIISKCGYNLIIETKKLEDYYLER